MALVLVINRHVLHKASQQSVHLTLGILRVFQAVFYALSFFWLDSFAVPRPSAGNANRWLAPPKDWRSVYYVYNLSYEQSWHHCQTKSRWLGSCPHTRQSSSFQTPLQIWQSDCSTSKARFANRHSSQYLSSSGLVLVREKVRHYALSSCHS